MKKFVTWLVLIFSVAVVNFSVANAEIKTYNASNTALMDFGDESPKTEETAKNMAEKRAIKSAFEKAGIFMLAFTETLEGKLTEEDISAMIREFAKVEDVKFEKYYFNAKNEKGEFFGRPGYIYEATVRVQIDTEKVASYMKLGAQEKQKLIEKDKLAKQNFEEVNRKFEDLRENANSKTPAQIKTELEQIDEKIKSTEKIPQQTNSQQINAPMIFSQPVEIGGIGFGPQSPLHGLPIRNATYNDGNGMKEPIDLNERFRRGLDSKKEILTYVKGTAGWDELYCNYDISNRGNYSQYPLKFGGKNNYVLSTDESDKKISKIETNQGIKIYTLYHNYCNSHLHILGKQKNGKWVVFLDSKKLSERYFGGNDGYKIDGGIIYEEPICDGDTIIVKYHRWTWKGSTETEGEFRFKWDDKAQWFGVEKVVN